MPLATFEGGLLDFRATLQDVPNFNTYYITSSIHTWIGGDDTFYNTTVGGVRLVDWFRDIVEGRSPGHVGP
jgi:hypothetical protein